MTWNGDVVMIGGKIETSNLSDLEIRQLKIEYYTLLPNYPAYDSKFYITSSFYSGGEVYINLGLYS